MSIQSRLSSVVRNVVRRARVERALGEEVESYLAMLVDEKIASGMAPDEALRAARIEVGGVEQVKEAVRAVRAGAVMEQLAQDVRYSLRSLRRAPAFTTVAIITLALGIGANTAIFSVVDAVLLRPLPVEDPEALVALYHGASGSSSAFSHPDYLDYRAQAQTLAGVAAWGGGNRLWFRAGGDLERASAQIVSGSYFDVLGVEAAIGRALVPDDDPAAGARPVAVISDAFWRRRFGADASVAGRAVTLNGHAFTIVGVAPAGFAGLAPASPPDVWVPIAALRLLEPEWDYAQRQERWLHVVARVRGGISLGEAQASLQPIGAAITGGSGATTTGEPSVRLVPARVAVFDPEARASSLRLASILMGVVAFVLLVACANVANLLLARSTARRRELGVRLAIGATRGRVARQVATESLVLACLGGAAGLAVAHWAIEMLVTLAPAAAVPPGLVIGIDGRVLTFALIISLGTGLVFGVVPAWHLSRLDALQVIKGVASSGTIGRASATPARRVLVVAQLALSVVLLVGAALFVRTLAAASAVPAGYDVDRVLLMSVDFAAPGAASGDAPAVLERTRDRVHAIPGVEAASFGQIAPFSGGFIGRPVLAEGRPLPAPGDDELIVPYNVVSAGYFRTLGMPLRGRDFMRTDSADSPRVVVINETLARRLWPGEDALGKRMYLPLRDPGPLHEVIGVVHDGKYVSLTEPQHPFMYVPLSQGFRPRLTLHVRTAGEPAAFVAQVRAAVREAAPGLPAFTIVTLGDHRDRSLARERLLARLLTGFGVLALAIAAIGIYGVLAYSIARRTGELGLRMALGARPADIVRLIATQSAALVGAGLIVGLAAALALTRLVDTFLFGVTPTDPVAFGAALAVLTLAAAAATSIPALRATRVDPLLALRSE